MVSIFTLIIAWIIFQLATYGHHGKGSEKA